MTPRSWTGSYTIRPRSALTPYPTSTVLWIGTPTEGSEAWMTV